MAQHGKQSEGPRIRWGSIVNSEQGYRLATMETVAGRPQNQHLGDAVSKAEAEDQFRVWAAENLFGWGSDE